MIHICTFRSPSLKFLAADHGIARRYACVGGGGCTFLLPGSLIPNPNEVITQLLDGISSSARLHALRVVCDENRLGRLDDDNALPTLTNKAPVSTALPTLARREISHLLPVNTPLISLQHNKSLPSNMQPRALHLLDAILAGILVRVDDLLHFCRRDLEARAGGPDAVAVAVEDGGLVDVAGADEAVRGGGERVRLRVRGGWGSRRGDVPVIDVCCAGGSASRTTVWR